MKKTIHLFAGACMLALGHGLLAQADLQVSEIELPPGPFYPGSRISAIVTVTNGGDAPSGATTLSTTLVAPPTGIGFSFDPVPVPALAPEASVVLSVGPEVIPLDNPNGTYAVRVFLAGTVEQAEFEIATKPDLRIADLQFEAGSWRAGDPIEMRIDYENAPFAGSARTVRVDALAAQAYYLEVVLSSDTVFGNDDDFLLHRRQIIGHPYAADRDFDPRAAVGDTLSSFASANLLPGDQVNYAWLQAIPANFAGDYFVLAKIDVDEAIDEYFEDDRSMIGQNVFYPVETAKITITPGSLPDPTTWRVSTDSDGAGGDQLSDEPAVSADGRFVAFSSLARLDAADLNDHYDVYLKDNYTGELILVSRQLEGAGAGGHSRFPAISADGAFVAFQSDSARLDPSDTNQHADIYLFERATGMVRRVSRGVGGALANSSSFTPSISGDGGIVAFASRATNLVAGGTTPGRSHVYAADTQTGAVTLLSADPLGNEADASSFEPVVSRDGAFVAFTSEVGNLAAGAGAFQQVYRTGSGGGAAVLISRSDGGTEGNGRSFHPAINADGSVVAFASEADNLDLTNADLNGVADVFIHDLTANTTRRILAGDGSEPNDPGQESTGILGSVQPSISDDGRFIVFRTQSNNLLPRTVQRSDGRVFNLPAYGPTGYFPVAEQSFTGAPGTHNAATDAIHGYSDINFPNPYGVVAASDIYLHDRENPGLVELISRDKFGYPAPVVIVGNEPNVPSSRNARISGDGRYVVFSHDGRGALGLDHALTNRRSFDVNEVRDVFIRDRRTLVSYAFDNPPQVRIDSPVDGANAAVGQPVALIADASDPNGYVSQVEFHANGQLVGSVSGGVFFLMWTPQQAGPVDLVAIATDDDGIRSVSDPVRINVFPAQAPTVTLTSPVDGQGYFSAQPLMVSALADDSDGIVSQVEFFLNGQSLQVVQQAPFQTEISSPNPGRYVFHAVATDDSGLSGYSAPVAITVANGDEPEVSIVQPAGDIVLGEETALRALVTGDGALFQSVDFYSNGVILAAGSLEGGFWSASFVPGALGQVALSAIATDSTGRSYASPTRLFSVASGLAPEISDILPDAADELTAGMTYELSARVVDADGSVSSVSASINGSAPQALLQRGVGIYSLDWTPVLNGINEVVITAVDNLGNVSTQTVLYSVSPPPSLDVSLISPVDGSSYLPGTILPVQVSAYDPNGLIQRIDFFLNGVLVDSVFSAPFRTEVQLPSSGTYVLTARAHSSTGAEGVSELVSLLAGPPDGATPRVVIDFPLPLGAGDTVNDVSYASAMFFNATVIDPDGGADTIESVEFFINGQKLGDFENRIGDVYSLFYQPNAQGNYVVSVRAVDNDGNVGWSVPMLLDVGPLERPLPTARMVQPFPQSIMGRTVGIFVEADGGLIDINRVDFFANGVYLGSADSPVVDNLYSFNWVPQEPDIVAGQRYALQARVVQIDPAEAVWDNWRIADPVYITITAPEGGAQPEIEITNPVDGVEHSVLRQIFLQVRAEDPLGSVEEVRFYVNGKQLPDVDTVFPYGTTFVPQSPGLFQFVAEMLTDRGLRVQSDPVAVRVVSGIPPTGDIVLPYVPGDRDPTAGSDVLIQVDASDPDGFIASTRLFINGAPLNSLFWRPVNPGAYDVTALITDNSGNEVIVERTINVVEQVGIAPRVTLSVTGSGNITPGSRVVVRASVFDDAPEGVQLTFFLNGQPIDDADRLSGNAIVVTPEIGFTANSYSLMVLATDADGNSRIDVLAPLYISDFSVDQPSIEIVSPANGEPLTLGSRAPVRVEVLGGAADRLANLVFYANGLEVGRIAGNERNFDWIPDRLGEIVLTAASLLPHEFYDHDGDSGGLNPTPMIPVTPVTVASPVNVTVNEPVGNLPSISLDVLPARENVAIGSKLLIHADAQDLGGSVERVDFYVDGNLMEAVDSPPFTYTLEVNRQGLMLLYATATDNDGNVVTSSYVDVVASSRVVTQTPEIVLTVPETGQEGSLLSLRASTQGFVNPPEAVVFHANGQEIGQSASAPYNYTWLANLNGDVTFFSTARQTLADGAVLATVSEVFTRNLAVNIPPAIAGVEVSFPNQSAVKPNPLAGEPLTFTISVEDTGPIQSVELLRDGDTVAFSSSAGSPFEVTDTPPGLGAYAYSVVVTDRGGLQTQSAVIPVSVVVGLAPEVTVTAPLAGADFRPGSVVQLRATASDPDGSVSQLSFHVNGIQVGNTLTAAPYQVDYLPPVAGSYTVTARARDNSGNLKVSDPVAFTVILDNPPVFAAFGNNLPGSTARLNQEVAWTMDVEDDYGLVSVKLFRDGTEVPSAAAVPLELTDTLTSLGRFQYYAEALDTAGNITRSEVIEITTTRGLPPQVEVTAPLPNATFKLDETLTLRASAFAASEQPQGRVEAVQFRLNGALLGTVTSTPYVLEGVQLQEGSNVIEAVAISDTGLSTVSAPVTVNGFDGSVPEILAFTSDAGDGRLLAGTAVNFEVIATDENGIQLVELLLQGAVVRQAVNSPARFTFIPEEAGSYRFTARVRNVDGVMTESDFIEVQVRYPNPLESNADFVSQTFVDLLMRSPSSMELNNYAGRIDQGDLTRDRFIRELIDPADGQAESDYDPVRASLLANRFLLNQWPTRDELESDVATVRDGGLKALVSSLMILFEPIYLDAVGGTVSGLPDILSPDPQISAYISYLFQQKYGVTPTSTQMNLALSHFRASGRDGFTANFIADVEVVATGSSYITMGLGFQFPVGSPPSDQYLREADAASLLINLLRIVPAGEEVTTLAGKLFAAQVAEVLANPRYAARFSTAFDAVEHHPNGWKHSQWFGTFNTLKAPWVYHLEQGWVLFDTTGHDEQEFRYYDPGMGWVWTRSSLFPVLYSESERGWFVTPRLPYSPGEGRFFLDLGSQQWIQR